MVGKIFWINHKENMIWYHVEPLKENLQKLDELFVEYGETHEEMLMYTSQETPYDECLDLSWDYCQKGVCNVILIARQKSIEVILFKGTFCFEKIKIKIEKRFAFNN